MEPFKNLLNKKTATRIVQNIQKNDRNFDSKKFLQNIEKELISLELKERVDFLARKLKPFLPDNQKKAIAILMKSLKKSEDDQEGLHGFEVWPLTHYISLYGLEHFDESMLALKEMTKVFTAEFAIRSFIKKDERKVLQLLAQWLDDENHHVRRLISEGTRPLLPWGERLTSFVIDPEKTFHLLEKLAADESEYVRKSVANHLNDHSKNHPEYVVKVLKAWKRKYGKDKNMDRLIRHASRTLIKIGHAAAFSLHGVEHVKLKISKMNIVKKDIVLGESLKVQLLIENLEKSKVRVIVDNEIHFLKANKSYTVKCFKGKSLSIDPLSKVKVEMQIPLKKVTTRKYYEGKQFWSPKINGVSERKLAFDLATAKPKV